MAQVLQQIEPTETTRASVFLSYSRDDLDFVQRLHAALEAKGIQAHLDHDDIAKGEAWWDRLKDLMTQSDVIVFVLSKASAGSSVCQQEVDFGETLNKRFIPVVIDDLTGVSVPDALRKLNYIFFVPSQRAGTDGDFQSGVDDLAEALTTDIQWIREHTRLGTVARTWSEADERSDMLLRGSVLQAAEDWMSSRPRDAPAPALQTSRLITESRRATTRRQRQWVTGSLTIAALAIGLAVFATLQWTRAENELRTKTARTLAVEARTALTEALQPGGLVRPDIDRSVLLALESLSVEPSTQGDEALRTALLKLGGETREYALPADAELLSLGPNADWFAYREYDQPPIVVDSNGTRPAGEDDLSKLGAATTFAQHGSAPEAPEHSGRHPNFEIREIDLSVVTDEDLPSGSPYELVDRASQNPLAVLPHEWFVQHAHFRPDGTQLMTMTGFVSLDAS